MKSTGITETCFSIRSQRERRRAAQGKAARKGDDNTRHNFLGSNPPFEAILASKQPKTGLPLPGSLIYV
jgi:hypothetical protein